MERIAVFCSSHDNLPEPFVQAAEQLGTWLGQNGKTLVYGGVKKGLMEVLAKAVRKNGGLVMGIIPDKMIQRGLESDEIDIEYPMVDLSDRKATILREADIFIALPGGFGTLDEIFSVVASALVGEHQKTVLLYNVYGYWNPLIQLFEEFQKNGTLSSNSPEHLLLKIDTFQELINFISK